MGKMKSCWENNWWIILPKIIYFLLFMENNISINIVTMLKRMLTPFFFVSLKSLKWIHDFIIRILQLLYIETYYGLTKRALISRLFILKQGIQNVKSYSTFIFSLYWSSIIKVFVSKQKRNFLFIIPEVFFILLNVMLCKYLFFMAL